MPPPQWQVGHGVAPDGTTFCQLVIGHGQVSTTVLLVPADMATLAEQLADVAREAATGLARSAASSLVIPTVSIRPNGHGPGR